MFYVMFNNTVFSLHQVVSNCRLCFSVVGILCFIRMIHMALLYHYLVQRGICMPVRPFRHLQRCCSLLWCKMLVSCLTLKHWTVACAKAIHLRTSMDRSLWILYISSVSPMTRFNNDFVVHSSGSLCIR